MPIPSGGDPLLGDNTDSDIPYHQLGASSSINNPSGAFIPQHSVYDHDYNPDDEYYNIDVSALPITSHHIEAASVYVMDACKGRTPHIRVQDDSKRFLGITGWTPLRTYKILHHRYWRRFCSLFVGTQLLLGFFEHDHALRNICTIIEIVTLLCHSIDLALRIFSHDSWHAAQTTTSDDDEKIRDILTRRAESDTTFDNNNNKGRTSPTKNSNKQPLSPSKGGLPTSTSKLGRNNSSSIDPLPSSSHTTTTHAKTSKSKRKKNKKVLKQQQQNSLYASNIASIESSLLQHEIVHTTGAFPLDNLPPDNTTGTTPSTTPQMGAMVSSSPPTTTLSPSSTPARSPLVSSAPQITDYLLAQQILSDDPLPSGHIDDQDLLFVQPTPYQIEFARDRHAFMAKSRSRKEIKRRRKKARQLAKTKQSGGITPIGSLTPSSSSLHSAQLPLAPRKSSFSAWCSRHISWSGIRLFFILLTFIDIFITYFCHFTPYRVYRVTRLLRPFFFVEKGRVLRKLAIAVLSTLPSIFEVVIILTLTIFTFGIVGFFLYSAKGLAIGPNAFFSDVETSLFSMTVLMTTANFPDVMMDSYSDIEAVSLFFVIFLIIALYLLFNIILSAVYTRFQYEASRILEEIPRVQLISLTAAFHLLARPSARELALQELEQRQQHSTATTTTMAMNATTKTGTATTPLPNDFHFATSYIPPSHQQQQPHHSMHNPTSSLLPSSHYINMSSNTSPFQAPNGGGITTSTPLDTNATEYNDDDEMALSMEGDAFPDLNSNSQMSRSYTMSHSGRDRTISEAASLANHDRSEKALRDKIGSIVSSKFNSRQHQRPSHYPPNSHIHETGVPTPTSVGQADSPLTPGTLTHAFSYSHHGPRPTAHSTASPYQALGDGTTPPPLSQHTTPPYDHTHIHYPTAPPSQIGTKTPPPESTDTPLIRSQVNETIIWPTFARFCHWIRPDLTAHQLSILFNLMDKDSDGEIQLHEWYQLTEIIDIRFVTQDQHIAEQQMALDLSPRHLFSCWKRSCICRILAIILTSDIYNMIIDALSLICFILLIFRLEGRDEVMFILDWFGLFLNWMFGIDLLCKLILFGRPGFGKSIIQCIESCIIIASIISTALVSFKMLRTEYVDIIAFRVIRLYRFLLFFPRFNAIVTTVKKLYPALRSLGILLLCEYYFFGILGQCFFQDVITKGSMSPAFMETYYAQNNYWSNNFNTLSHSFIVLFEVMIINNWNLLIEGFTMALESHLPRLFFIAHFFLSIMVILNCVIALILDAFISRYVATNLAAKAKEDKARGYTIPTADLIPSILQSIAKDTPDADDAANDNHFVMKIKPRVINSSVPGQQQQHQQPPVEPIVQHIVLKRRTQPPFSIYQQTYHIPYKRSDITFIILDMGNSSSRTSENSTHSHHPPNQPPIIHHPSNQPPIIEYQYAFPFNDMIQAIFMQNTAYSSYLWSLPHESYVYDTTSNYNDTQEDIYTNKKNKKNGNNNNISVSNDTTTNIVPLSHNSNSIHTVSIPSIPYIPMDKMKVSCIKIPNNIKLPLYPYELSSSLLSSYIKPVCNPYYEIVWSNTRGGTTKMKSLLIAYILQDNIICVHKLLHIGVLTHGISWRKGTSPFHLCRSKEMVLLLLLYGISPNQLNKEGRTASYTPSNSSIASILSVVTSTSLNETTSGFNRPIDVLSLRVNEDIIFKTIDYIHNNLKCDIRKLYQCFHSFCQMAIYDIYTSDHIILPPSDQSISSASNPDIKQDISQYINLYTPQHSSKMSLISYNIYQLGKHLDDIQSYRDIQSYKSILHNILYQPGDYSLTQYGILPTDSCCSMVAMFNQFYHDNKNNIKDSSLSKPFNINVIYDYLGRTHL